MSPFSQLSRNWTACLILILASLITPAVTVKESLFKKCHQSGFCTRNRAYADYALTAPAWQAPYSVIPNSVSFENGNLQATIIKAINDQGQFVRLPLTVSFLQSGTARITIDEEKRQKGEIDLRHNSKARKERYNEAQNWAISGGLDVDESAKVSEQDSSRVRIRYGPSSKLEVVIKFSPLSIDFKRGGETHVIFNERGLLNLEHWRSKVEKPASDDGHQDEEQQLSEATDPPAEDDEKTWWEESFGGVTDTKPRGPESVGLDISFPGYEYVFGIPSHAGPLSLKQTRGGDGNYQEPYRLYNLDVFEYILDSPMSLYGAIPFMQAHRKDSTVGVFWLNGAETWIDITKAKDAKNPAALIGQARMSTHTHWFSESGLIDVFVFLGPKPQDVTRNYGALTGYTAMPQEFAIGYHQCRWNYVSDEDAKNVDRKMDQFKIPYDVIWLDIEYTDEKKYFTWDPHTFPDPIGLGRQLDEHGRKVVTIIDPHLKNDKNYQVDVQLQAKDLGVHTKDGNIYEGSCWPGSSHWIDCFNPAAVEFWKSLFKYDTYQGSMENTFVWNDMNEPSVFTGPETTMPKDNLHYGNWEHRDVHNIYGMTFHNATHQALLSRKDGELRRPFVLTRSYFAGAQRVGAMWTGDNQAQWGHLAVAFPMLLSLGIAGFPFAGADVGGFFGDPDKELQVRWYQAGAFYPFYRGHAHIDSRRREPYLLGEPYTSIVTAAIRLRYTLLPAWYTAFHHAHIDGTPIIQPMFYTNPEEEAGFEVDDQAFLGGTGLLVHPVVEPGVDKADIFIPDDEVYYDYFTYEVVRTKRGKRVTRAAPLDQLPVLMRGGHIFPRRDTPRRSSALMHFDDYTLVVTVGKTTSSLSSGELYVDDGDSFDFQHGQYIHRRLTFDAARGVLTSVDAEDRDAAVIAAAAKEGTWLHSMADVRVGTVIIVGAPKIWSSVTIECAGVEDGRQTRPAEMTAAQGSRAAFAIVRGVKTPVGADWKMTFA